MRALAVMPRGLTLSGSCALMNATPLASREIVVRNVARSTAGRSLARARSEEGVTGIERESERHPAVVLSSGIEVAENMGGDRAHIAPAPLDRALVTQRAGPGHLHQILNRSHQDAARAWARAGGWSWRRSGARARTPRRPARCTSQGRAG